jgi:uncharacterized protein
LDEQLVSVAAPPPGPQRAKRDLHWVFVGADGLRAGWGALLFAVLFVLFLLLSSSLFHHLFRGIFASGPLELSLALLREVTQFLSVLLATAVMARIEGRSLLAYGYQGTSKASRFFWGVIWGFVSLTVLLGVLWKARLLVFDGELLHGAAVVQYALGWGVMFLVVAVFEESTLRGYLQYTMSRGIGFWWGAILLSAMFGFSHGTNPGETPVGLFAAAAIAIVFCISLYYTGSLWWAVGFHASWDWAESYFYGTSDSGLTIRGHLLGSHPMGPRLWSGGATGPEGSLCVLVLVVSIGLIMWRWWGPRVVSPFRDGAWRPAWSRRAIAPVE